MGESRYTGLGIPNALATLSPSCSGLIGSFAPDQEMRNWIAREMADGSARIPAYTPYLLPKQTPQPRTPDKTDYSTSSDGSGGK